MTRKEIVEAVEQYLQPILEELHYELVDVEYVKEGKEFYLRIYIDKDGGVTIEDCQITSRAIGAVLDEKDFIEDAYILEVSSPGLDRVLKKDREFKRFEGRLVDVKLYEAVDKQKKFQGILKGKTEEKLSIEDEEGNCLDFDMKNVAVVRLAVVF